MAMRNRTHDRTQHTPQSDFGTLFMVSPYQVNTPMPGTPPAPQLPPTSNRVYACLNESIMNSPSLPREAISAAMAAVPRSALQDCSGGLPFTFAPRLEPNMSSSKKVASWLQELPVITSSTSYFDDCYRPGMSFRDIDEAEPGLEEVLMDSIGDKEYTNEDIIDLQAKQIVFLTSKLYSLEGSADPEQVLLNPRRIQR